MKMLIPNTKTELILLEPWTFRLFYEGRNHQLLLCVGVDLGQMRYQDRYVSWGTSSELNHTQATLPAGTVLRVSRVYIRQGTADTFDSLTFQIKMCPNKAYKGRFWAKLGDINGKMDAELYFGQTLTPEERVSRMTLLFA